MCDFDDDDYDNDDHPDYERYYFSDPMPPEDAEKCQFCVFTADRVYDGMNLCMLHYIQYTFDMDAIFEELAERKYKNRSRSQSYFRL